MDARSGVIDSVIDWSFYRSQEPTATHHYTHLTNSIHIETSTACVCSHDQLVETIAPQISNAKLDAFDLLAKKTNNLPNRRLSQILHKMRATCSWLRSELDNTRSGPSFPSYYVTRRFHS